MVSKDHVVQRAQDIAREMIACSPEVQAHVRWLTHWERRTEERQRRLDAEIERFALHVQGRDLTEGLSAFTAKRAPAYEG